MLFCCLFFFKQKTAYEMRISDWSSDVCSSDLVEFPDGKQIIILSKGRLVNLGNATGHPSFVMSASFTNQTLAQIELWTRSEQYKNDVYVLPKHLDDKVAALQLDTLGVKISQLSQKQADYIGVPVEGPSKPPLADRRDRQEGVSTVRSGGVRFH